MTYAEKLKHPKWQKKRLEVLQRDGFKCVDCGDTETMLHVHHKKYTGKNPWDAPIEDLETLCEDCHEINHIGLTELEAYLFGIIRSMSNDYPFIGFTPTEFIKIIQSDIKSYK